MAESDPKDNRFVTHGLLKRLMGRMGEAIATEVANPMQVRLDALEKRIKALEQGTTDAL
jgi:hypothetical protein